MLFLETDKKENEKLNVMHRNIYIYIDSWTIYIDDVHELLI